MVCFGVPLFLRYISMKGREQSWPFRLPRRRGGGRLKIYCHNHRNWHWDHPRTRGEKPGFKTAKSAQSGSPPHTRGKVPKLPAILDVYGITPAHAGKSNSRFDDPIKTKDHPRACGEKDKLLIDQVGLEGSPPHTRGKGNGSPAAGHPSGITPAHAGKS